MIASTIPLYLLERYTKARRNRTLFGAWKRVWNLIVFLIFLFAGINLGLLIWTAAYMDKGHCYARFTTLLRFHKDRLPFGRALHLRSKKAFDEPRGRILIGVMTSNKFLGDRVSGALGTWAHDMCVYPTGRRENPESHGREDRPYGGKKMDPEPRYNKFHGNVIFLGERAFSPFNDSAPFCLDHRVSDSRYGHAHREPIRNRMACRANFDDIRVDRRCFVAMPDVYAPNEYPPMIKAFSMLRHMYEHYIANATPGQGDLDSGHRKSRTRFDWFMRLDDDTYIRPRVVENFLNTLDPDLPHYIGQMGLGKMTDASTRNLFQDSSTVPKTNARTVRSINYCMSGTGFILSRALLETIGPHLGSCLRERISMHDDVEIGRCIHKYSNDVSCVWAYDVTNTLDDDPYYFYCEGINIVHCRGGIFFHNNYQGTSVQAPELAFTYHPLKKKESIYLIHSMYISREIRESLMAHFDMKRNLNVIKNSLKGKPPDNRLRRPSQLSKSQIPVYSLISRGSKTMFTNTIKNVQIGLDPSVASYYEGLMNDTLLTPHGKEIKRMTYLQNANIIPSLYFEPSQPGITSNGLRMTCVFQNLSKRYENVPLRALPVKWAKSKLNYTIPFSGHTFEIKIPFQPLLFYHQPDPLRIIKSKPFFIKPTQRIHIIVPFSNRYGVLTRYLKSFEKILSSHSLMQCCPSIEIHLLVVVFREVTDYGAKQRLTADTASYKALLRYVRGLNYKYGHETHRSLIDVHLAKSGDNFSRASALTIGASLKRQGDLLLFLDVDMEFNVEFLKRVASFTVRGISAYFPIVFSYYNHSSQLNRQTGAAWPKPRDSSLSVFHSESTGFWNYHGYGICAVYGSDFWDAGGFDTTIRNWGKEDIDFFTRILNRTSIKVFRSADPGIVHIYHQRSCVGANEKPDQYGMCIDSMASYTADKMTLGRWLNYGIII